MADVLSITLTAAAVLADRRDTVRAVVLAAAAFLSAGVVWLLTNLQPTGASTLVKYGVQNRPGFMFSVDWWLRHWQWPPHPRNADTVLLLPTAIVLCLESDWWFWRRDR